MAIYLSEARRRAGMTQKDVAKAMGVSVFTVARWEKGKHKPKIAEIKMLAELCGISTEEIFFADSAR